ncbi:MAG TPA: hypothetical protein VIG66_07795 [Noviherbaspirillum sp.]
MTSTAGAQAVAPSSEALQPLERIEGTPPAKTHSAEPNTDAIGATETRLPGGRVTEITVHSGNSTYTMRPQTPTSAAGRDSGRTVQWNVFSFDPPRGQAPQIEAAPVPPPPSSN